MRLLSVNVSLPKEVPYGGERLVKAGLTRVTDREESR
jgi:hypothetical protein